MSQRATAKGLSSRARSLINNLLNSGSSESVALGTLLDEVAESDGTDTSQASDEFLTGVCQEIRAAALWFMREVKKNK